VQSGDARSGWFFDLHQMPQISPTEAIRHGVYWVERLIISGVFRVLKVKFPCAGEDCAMAGQSGGQYTVEHVDSGVNCVDYPDWVTNTH
jgi:hypothetical protein